VSKIISLADIVHWFSPVIPLKLLYASARVNGRFRHLVRPGESSAVRNNLQATFGKTKSEHEIDSLARQFFEFKQLRSLLLILSQGWSLSRMSDFFPLQGVEHLDQALAQKKGVLLLGCHLNSLCMFSVIIMLRKMGYDVRVAMPQPADPWAPSLLRRIVNRLTNEQTLAEQIGAFYCQFNIRPIIQCLASNVIVGQTGDGWHSARFVEVEFLGQSLPFTTGLVSISQITGAPIVPLFQVGVPPDRLTCILEEPFTVEKGENPDEEVRKKVAAYVKRLEYHLLENIPCWEHWLIENTLDTMATWPQKSLTEKYVV